MTPKWCSFVAVAMVCGLTAAACSSAPSHSVTYPPTRTVDVVDDYHGTKVADPYRWLEDLDSKEVRDWAAAQTNLFESIVRAHPSRTPLFERMTNLGESWDAYGAGDADAPKPLIDEKTLGEGRTLSNAWKSPDGKHIAYTVSNRGSEWEDLRVRRVADARDLTDAFEPLLWTEALWTKDSRGFFYGRSERPAAGERTLLKNQAIYYHRLNTPQSADTPVFQTPAGTTDVVLEHQISGDGRYLFIGEGNGAGAGSIGWLNSRMHVVDLGDPQRPNLAAKPWPLTEDRDRAYRVVASDTSTLYVLTDRGAPKRRLVAVDIANPTPDQWRDVIPESDALLEHVEDIGGRFLTVHVSNLQVAVRVLDRRGALVRDLRVPPMMTVHNVHAGGGPNDVVMGMSGFVTPPSRARINVVTGVHTPIVPAGKPPLDVDVQLVWYPSKDGVRVPMYVLHRRGLARDGSHPIWLHGYGASSQLVLPEFAEHIIATLELGFVVAMPALRGGGDLGRTWYEAATLERKQTTFDDFIAAAEYLVAEKYGARERVAIEGSSNGGLLVAAVITQRPDLFRVAVADVPQTDAIRYDRGRHLPQFGSAKNPAHFPFLYAYSPQHRVKTGTCYPSTLITAALNDDRVPAWLPMKFTAALQAAQSCDRPILLRVNSGGGHAGDYLEHSADSLAFIVRELGVAVRVPSSR